MSPAEEIKFVNDVCANALAQTSDGSRKPVIFVKTRAFVIPAQKAAPGCEVQVNRSLANPASWRVNHTPRR